MRLKTILFLIAFTCFANESLIGQSPGGVSTGLSLWLKANTGTTGNPVSAWSDQSGNANDATQGTVADQPALTASSLNFNPGLTFNGSTDVLNTPAISINANSRIFIVGQKTNSTDAYIQIGAGSNRGITELDYGTSWDAFSNYIENAGTSAPVVGGTLSTSLLVEGYTGSTLNLAFNIGYATSAFTYLNGTINEIAFYNPGSALSTANVNQIESYLALKYGITLDVTGSSGNYYNASGSSVYDNTIAGYWNNIAGLGRDINSGLNQEVSTTVNTASDVIMATTNDFVSANGSGGRTALTNGKYIVWGDNGSGINYTQTTNLTATGSYTYRTDRGWKITNTNNVGAVNLQFSGIGAATGNYYLLSDDDGNYTNGGTSVLATSASLTFTGVTFPSGTSFFTIAFIPVTPAPQSGPGGVIPYLSLWLKANAGTTGNPVSAWTDQSASVYNATQATVANQPALTSNALNFNPGLTFNGSSDYLITPNVAVSTNSYIFIVGQKANATDAYIQIGTGNHRGITESDYGATYDVFNTYSENALTTSPAVGGTLGSNLLLEGSSGNAFNLPFDIGFATSAFTYLNGVINEIAFYNPPSSMSALNINQIESYLAIKYGITLDVTGTGGNYYNASGSSVYDNTVTGYWNNIAGLGNDATSTLDQRVSGTANTANDVIMATTNDFVSANGGARTALTTGQYLVWGDNGSGINYTQTTNLTATGSYTYRTDRGWKITNTGGVGAVELQFSGIGAATGNYYLLSDDDGNYTNGGTSVLATSATLTFTGVTFPSNTSFFTVAFIPVTPSPQIGPGGITANLSLWLEANVGTTGNPVSAWTDQSSHLYNATQGTVANQPALTSGALNFNPGLTFNGSTDALNTPSIPVSSNSRIFIVGHKANSSDAYIEVGTNTHRGITELDYATTYDVFNNYIENASAAVPAVGGTLGTDLLLEGYNGNVLNLPFNIGYAIPAFTYLNGVINEVAMFNPPSAMSTASVNQVESYLAVKYGLTLDVTGASSNYYNASGGSVFDNTVTGYWNNIAGLGNDALSGLDQRVSTTANTANDVIIATTNDFVSANGGARTALTNGQYLVWGDNGVGINYTQTTNIIATGSYTYRTDRGWKITNTGNVGAVNLQFTGIGAATGNYYLLGDNDGDYTNGGTSVLATSATLTFTGVLFPSGTSYFTVAFIPVVPMPQVAPGGVLPNLALWLKADVGTTGNPVSAWADQSASGYNATQGAAADKPALTSAALNYNPALTFNGSTDYMTTPAVSLTTHSRIFVVGKKANSTDVYVQTGTNTNRGISDLSYGTNWDIFSSYIENASTSAAPAGGTLSTSLLTEGYNATAQNVAFHIGYALSGFTYLNGAIEEMAVYNPTVSLSATNVTEIESYFAVKYGITLNVTGVSSNYLSSAGTVIYNNTLGSFWNQIIGIGRDDNAGLKQMQSHTSADSTRIYLSTLAATNAANAGTFTNDQSYIMMGNDQLRVWAGTDEATNKPASVLSRLSRMWKITNTNFPDSYSIDVKLSPLANPGFVAASNLIIMIRPDTNFTAATVIASGTNGITITYSNPTITISGLSTALIPLNSIRYLVIGSTSASTPLPIKLTDFTAIPDNDGNVLINWITATEVNNKQFVVQKTADGVNYDTVAMVAGAGNSNKTISYNAIDEHPFSGLSYYRLEQIDFDESSTYSSLVPVDFELNNNFTIFPNPVHSSLLVSYDSPDNNFMVVDIFDVTGRIVMTNTVHIDKGKNTFAINARYLPSGIYFIKASSADNTFKDKFIKE